jgi:hypothetical protein
LLFKPLFFLNNTLYLVFLIVISPIVSIPFCWCRISLAQNQVNSSLDTFGFQALPGRHPYSANPAKKCRASFAEPRIKSGFRA